MNENVNVQYIGFAVNGPARAYSFVVRRALNQLTEFTLTIGTEWFRAGRVRFQDGAEICSRRLHRELATSGSDHPSASYQIKEVELDDYRKSQPKAATRHYKPTKEL
jgi:hypothetical protein